MRNQPSIVNASAVACGSWRYPENSIGLRSSIEPAVADPHVDVGEGHAVVGRPAARLGHAVGLERPALRASCAAPRVARSSGAAPTMSVTSSERHLGLDQPVHHRRHDRRADGAELGERFGGEPLVRGDRRVVDRGAQVHEEPAHVRRGEDGEPGRVDRRPRSPRSPARSRPRGRAAPSSASRGGPLVPEVAITTAAVSGSVDADVGEDGVAVGRRPAGTAGRCRSARASRARSSGGRSGTRTLRATTGRRGRRATPRRAEGRPPPVPRGRPGGARARSRPVG